MGSILPPSTARAEDEAPAEPGSGIDADALVRRGLELRMQGRDVEALAAFHEAQAARPSPRALALVALTEQALGEWRAAGEHLRAAVTAEDDPWIREHRHLLEQALAVIIAHAPAPESAAADARAPAPPALPARPPGDLAAGAPDSARALRIAAAAAGAAGVVLVSAGVVSSINVGTDSHANQSGPVFSPDREDSGKRAETLQWVFYGAGAAALGASLAIALYANQRARPDPRGDPRAGATARLAPFVTATGGGLALTVRR
jgi:hypothetical protein